MRYHNRKRTLEIILTIGGQMAFNCVYEFLDDQIVQRQFKNELSSYQPNGEVCYRGGDILLIRLDRNNKISQKGHAALVLARLQPNNTELLNKFKTMLNGCNEDDKLAFSKAIDILKGGNPEDIQITTADSK